MILVDFSQIVMSSALSYHAMTKESIDINLLRHIALNNIIQFKKKFSREFDKTVVLCFDGKYYWRRDVFLNYKKNRAKGREESKFDWDNFFDCFNQLKKEFKENLPYKVIENDRAEADDIISTLCQRFRNEDILIISSDHDFQQLHSLSDTIKQYSPLHKKMLSDKNYSLFEHIVKGDSGDGIPNILSDDDVFLTEKRSRPITTKKLKEWEEIYNFAGQEGFCSTSIELDNFNRNKKLVDLTQIPKELMFEINKQYDEFPNNCHNTFNYLMKHKLVKILEGGAL